MEYRNLCTIVLHRFKSNSVCTRGEIILGSSKFQTLEPSKPIIPYGAYLLRPTYSPSFSSKYPYNSLLDKKVPEVLGVTGHSGVRIHVGNYPSDTKGCILIGKSGSDSTLLNSSVAYKEFCVQLQSILIKNPNAFFVLYIFGEDENE